MATMPQSYMGTTRPGPSDFLMSAFRACSRDPTEEIRTRLSSMLQTFRQHSQTKEEQEENSKELIETCCFEAEVCYYELLENIVREPKWTPEISKILCEESIQRCLVASCLDISITLHQLPYDLTVLLRIFKLIVYHFPIAIELVQECRMDCFSSKHLCQTEIKILELLMWTSDSPLWKEIKANENIFPACQEVMPATQLEDPNRANSPSEPDQPQAPGVEVPGASAVTKPLKSILVFLARKVYKLTSSRLSEICSKLSITDELRLKIWTCFEHCLVHCSGLMVDAHLDLLLLYTVFKVAKVTETHLLLSSLINCYKTQHYASDKVSVDMFTLGAIEDLPTKRNDGADFPLTPITPSGPELKGRLRDFHQNYSQKMNGFIQQFGSSFGVETPRSPYPLPQKKTSHRLRSNIYISLFKESIPVLSPGFSHCFGLSSPENLRKINSKIKASGSRKRACRAVSFDESEGEEDGVSSEGGSLEKRLRSVVVDREKLGKNQQPDGKDETKLEIKTELKDQRKNSRHEHHQELKRATHLHI